MGGPGVLRARVRARQTTRATDALTRLGLRTAEPGVWIAPGHLTSETREVLERRGLAAYVEIFEGQHVAFGELSRPQS